MQEQSVDLVIIGAGTAGISAFKEASKVTKKIILIDHGPLGTTCARVGCMPSKTLLQVADYFHDRTHFSDLGIEGANQLQINIPHVMEHVRNLRDYFTSGTIKYLESLGENFIQGNAEFIDQQTIQVNNKKITSKAIIIATGSSSIIPAEWSSFKDEVLITENFFEQTNFSQKIAVIGGGAVGIELGQALSRLGIEIELFHSHEFISALTDPIVNACAVKIFTQEFPLHLNTIATVEKNKTDFTVKSADHAFSAEQIVAALGRHVNTESLNLKKLNLKFDKSGIPLYDRTTMQIEKLPLYIAGDVGKFRPLLHEAADEGRIAGYNAVRDKSSCFTRRTPLSIIFSQPNIASVGQSFEDLQNSKIVIGEVSFEDQGRARILSQNQGILRIYADKQTGKLLGAEMIAPQGEHIAHLLAHGIQQNMTTFDMLRMPFYHPTIEEGMRTALRHAASQVKTRHDSLDLAMCDSEAISNLC